jgi:hypothetical protein
MNIPSLLTRQVRCPNAGFAELSNNLYNRKGYATVSRDFQRQHRSETTKFWKNSKRMEVLLSPGQVSLVISQVHLILQPHQHRVLCSAALPSSLIQATSPVATTRIQVALFVVPALVFPSYAIARPMNLLFTSFEVVSVGLVVLIVSLVAVDGESNWMEGVIACGLFDICHRIFFLPQRLLAA